MIEDAIDLLVFIAFIGLLYLLASSFLSAPLEKEKMVIKHNLEELRYEYILTVMLKSKVENETMFDLTFRAKDDKEAWEKWKKGFSRFSSYFKDGVIVIDGIVVFKEGKFIEGWSTKPGSVIKILPVKKKFFINGKEHTIEFYIEFEYAEHLDLNI